MLESTQGSFFNQDLFFHPITVILEFMRAVGNTVMQLVSAEDTCEKTGGRKHQASQYEGSAVFGAFKLVFWMAAAITLSILIGQLS